MSIKNFIFVPNANNATLIGIKLKRPMRQELMNILDICAQVFDVTIEEVQSPCRRQEVSYCRKAFCLFSTELYSPKADAIACIIHKTRRAVALHLSSQPHDRYYENCVVLIRSMIDGSK